jgi:hypothetical protein
MNSADAAGCKDFQSGTMRNPDRGSDCRGAVPTSRDCDRYIASADLSDVVAIGE